MRDLIGIDEHGYMLNSQNLSFGKVTKRSAAMPVVSTNMTMEG